MNNTDTISQTLRPSRQIMPDLSSPAGDVKATVERIKEHLMHWDATQGIIVIRGLPWTIQREVAVELGQQLSIPSFWLGGSRTERFPLTVNGRVLQERACGVTLRQIDKVLMSGQSVVISDIGGTQTETQLFTDMGYSVRVFRVTDRSLRFGNIESNTHAPACNSFEDYLGEVVL